MLVDILNQTKQPYYAKYFLRALKSGPYLSWNWSAFVFSSFWLIKRKLYAYSAFFLAISLLGAQFFSQIGLPYYWGSAWILFCMCGILPVTANALYFLQTTDRIRKNRDYAYYWLQPHGILATVILNFLMVIGFIFIINQLLALIGKF